MIVLGLTGGIGMGKSTTADLFAARGVPVWDADAAVHRLYEPGGAAVAPLSATFGTDMVDPEGGIDRGALSRFVLADPQAIARLEAIVHPLVRADRETFLEVHRERGTKTVLLDIPLLLETGDRTGFDRIIVCSAPEEVRRARVLARPGMTAEKYAAIVARQMPDAEKRRHADHVVPTGEGVDIAAKAVDAILADLPSVP